MKMKIGFVSYHGATVMLVRHAGYCWRNIWKNTTRTRKVSSTTLLLRIGSCRLIHESSFLYG